MTDQRLRAAAGGVVPNAIMPLFWQKGGPVEVVREEMERIGDAGIGAVILEARPHPEYLGDGWWRDVDAVLEIAKRRGMKVWFFDDDTFPTGHAAGAVEDAPADARRRFVAQRFTDAVGPSRGASFIVERRKFWGPEAAQEPGDLLRVVAYRRAEDSAELVGEPVDLTDRVADGVLHWDVPDGWWRVFFVTVSADGGSEHHANHIDYLSSASTQLLIDAVYETIHSRYADEFGSTIAGFFSDEPGLYNDPDTFDFDSRLGKPVPLPWNDEVASALATRFAGDPALLLPLLWSPAGGREREVRFAFMDAVTRLYSENFSRRIGDWCRAHGVEYIGHVIEDNGSHARLGPGAGHYFRAMAGQDMAGVDIIGGQVVPGFSRGPFGNMTGAADGEFFHFGLAKLASSAAHLDPLKQGRSMCETIGAYGWYAGLRLFTWLTNHLLVRGVTHVVPHAFSPAPFPDLDCPPHFYANGQNPQYPHQHLLSAYTNRLSHLLQGGTHIAPFAVLYHAEAEWLGEAMPSERPLRLLMEAQLDADIVPADALCGAEAAEAAGGALRLGGETYDALIVPGSAFLPEHVAAHLLRLDDAGVPVVFVDSVPEVTGSAPDSLQVRFRALPQRKLAEAASAMTDRAVRLGRRAPSVRVLRRDLGDADVVMLVNESTRDTVRSAATLPRAGRVVSFDAFTGRLTAVPSRPARSGTAVELDLLPGDAIVLILGDPSAWEGIDVGPATVRGTARTLSPTWQVATAAAGASFAQWQDLTELRPLSDPDLLPRFSGTARYTATFDAAGGEPGGPHSLDLGDVYELATVRLNGVGLGTRIAPPYRFDVPDGVLSVRNTLEVEVVNTLAKAQPDFFSAFAQQEPTGLLGPVTIAPLRPEGER